MAWTCASRPTPGCPARRSATATAGRWASCWIASSCDEGGSIDVFGQLQIGDRRERWLVGLADAGLCAARVLPFLRSSRAPSAFPHRILLLRLERVGDLLMAL